MAATGSDPNALAADPRNDLMWRFDLRRLTAEELRDSILALNGTLNRKVYGPRSSRQSPRRCWLGNQCPARWDTSGPEDSARRSVYVHVKRSLRLPIRKLRRRRARHDLPGAVRDGAADPGAGDAEQRIHEPGGRNSRSG